MLLTYDRLGWVCNIENPGAAVGIRCGESAFEQAHDPFKVRLLPRPPLTTRITSPAGTPRGGVSAGVWRPDLIATLAVSRTRKVLLRMQNPTSGVVVEGTLRADSAVAMSIDPQGMAHIMGVLTNLYSDAPLAVVREYATNARDAHQAAGVTRPIEVGLPTALDPTLRVQDFGAGLSEQDILGVYARYGCSTKRDSDEQVGAFGLGSKSAFTLAQQFVVTSVHDGCRPYRVS